MSNVNSDMSEIEMKGLIEKMREVRKEQAKTVIPAPVSDETILLKHIAELKRIITKTTADAELGRELLCGLRDKTIRIRKFCQRSYELRKQYPQAAV